MRIGTALTVFHGRTCVPYNWWSTALPRTGINGHPFKVALSRFHQTTGESAAIVGIATCLSSLSSDVVSALFERCLVIFYRLIFCWLHRCVEAASKPCWIFQGHTKRVSEVWPPPSGTTTTTAPWWCIFIWLTWVPQILFGSTESKVSFPQVPLELEETKPNTDATSNSTSRKHMHMLPW